mmetsp:Transcript_27292/g.70302  ORF Transcript_27292/g.70302 Transcript_27292/m.70302 type:complete len:128 (-) Transcript_27292:1073-1456(-)|eukprot:scaffold112315_cov18-Tisochrysis_lutea.AAC.2
MEAPQVLEAPLVFADAGRMKRGVFAKPKRARQVGCTVVVAWKDTLLQSFEQNKHQQIHKTDETKIHGLGYNVEIKEHLECRGNRQDYSRSALSGPFHRAAREPGQGCRHVGAIASVSTLFRVGGSST